MKSYSKQKPNHVLLDKLQRLISLIHDAIAGTPKDLTTGSIRRSVILLAIPMVLEMAMESIFAVVDIFFVSRWAETNTVMAVADTVAIVGITEAVLSILYAVGVGVAMGVTAVVARRIGEKNPEGAALAAGQTMWVGLVVSVVVAAIGLSASRAILTAMGANESVILHGTSYLTIMLGGSFTIVYLFLLGGIFRGAGNATIVMKGLWLANCINMVLDPCLIFGVGPFPELGVVGAAVATNCGRIIGMFYLLYYLCNGKAFLKVAWHHLAVVPTVIVNILRVSLFGVVQFFIATASWVVLMNIMATHGSAAIAGYTIAIRLVILTFLPAWGFSNAAATLVGQNLGAHNPQRAEQAVWQTVRYNMSFMFVTALVYFFASPWLMQFFTRDPIVIDFGVQCLRIVSLGYVFFAMGQVLIQAFNGSGDTWTPTWINMICFWIIQIPLAKLASDKLELGPSGVFWAITIAETLIAFIALWQFRRGRWQLQKV